MQIKTKPIKGDPQLSKTYKRLVLDLLPIHKWEAEQKAKRANIKL